MPGPTDAPRGPVDPNDAATAAVQAGVQLPQARTVGGTATAITATPVGATGLTVGQNVAFAGVGNVAVDAPEVPALGWVVTFLFQGLKHNHHVNQDRHKWFLIPIMAFLVGFAVWLLTTHGDVLAAGAQALKSCGLIAINAVSNYHSTKPLGIFSSAAEMG